MAQKLRDEAAEGAAYDTEVERLRAEGLPVLAFDEADDADGSLLLEDMRTVEGEPVPVDQWAALDGVAVIVTEEWEYPETETDPETEDDEDAPYDEEAKAVTVSRQRWEIGGATCQERGCQNVSNQWVAVYIK